MSREDLEAQGRKVLRSGSVIDSFGGSGALYTFQRFPRYYSWLNRANYVLIAAN